MIARFDGGVGYYPRDLMHFPLAAVLIAALHHAPAQPVSRGQQPASITGVSLTPGPVVVVTATAALPVPRVGVLRSPDRIYLDLPGVWTHTLKASGDGTLVTVVRIAQNSLEPRVARVVIDLKQPCRYSLNTAQAASGRLEVSLSADASAPAPARAPVSAAPAPAAPIPVPPAPAPPRRIAPETAAARYLAVVRPALDRLGTLREVLRAIDQRTPVTPDQLKTAQSELTAFQSAIQSAKPPQSLAGTHDLLKSVVGFAFTALSLSAEQPGEVSPNASSAAAGALLMLDRAESALGGGRKSL